ncbi:MAG TPA: protein kinase [Polyangia bacterium]|nr:protein kinase [Polyangia bacterium]
MELSDPKIGTAVAGRYRLDERLGAGGMGVVYKGEDNGSRNKVAVKFLHDAFAGMPDLVKRFEREVAAMRCIDHPNLVGIVDSGVEAGVPYLVMDFQSGKPLAELVERGALPPARAVGLARQILAGVAAAHASGVVHRDLKPDNIMLLDDVDGDFVKIFDFGLAKMVHGSTQATKLTNTGFALGTPSYMAPEQATGAPTDERADIYAIGVMLYHMVTGRVPFEADSPMAVLLKHADETPVPPRKAARHVRISDELEAAILRALEKEPAKRWPSAEAFAGVLAATPEGGDSKVPLLEISMREIGDSKTVLGRCRSDATSSNRSATLRSALPMRWIVRLAVAAIVGVGLMMLWSRISRRERQHVVQKVDDAVGSAKGILHSLTQPMSTPPQATRPNTTDDDDARAPAAHDTPGARLEAASRASRRRAGTTARAARLQDASRLLANGKLDDSIQTLYQLRRQNPRSAEVALLLGHAYSRKQWRADALREYGEALRLRPSLRSDRQLQRYAIGALDDPTFKAASAFIRARLGSAAVGELRRAGRQATSPKVQTRAARLAVELADAGRASARR